ncbi:unnamed protein product [Prunus armeniaca]|uniref:Uncharacterized protein n=1 Tax=Prunus armeniaca TaxID=36596 RepID=A0A6J5U9N3_PRUAR|nr:unnamed protein product [Prunus armeniaca]
MQDSHCLLLLNVIGEFSTILKVGIMPRLSWCHERVLGKLEDGRLSCFKWLRSFGEEIANFQLKFESNRTSLGIFLIDINCVKIPDQEEM